MCDAASSRFTAAWTIAAGDRSVAHDRDGGTCRPKGGSDLRFVGVAMARVRALHGASPSTIASGLACTQSRHM